LSENGGRWIAAPEKFLFPVRVLAKVFRGKYTGTVTFAFRASLKFDLSSSPGFSGRSTDFHRLNRSPHVLQDQIPSRKPNSRAGLQPPIALQST